MKPIISLTTDFGTQDSYVAQMKGVMLSICPDVSLVDVTHEIEQGNLAKTAYILGDLVQSFQENAIHLYVVDPGVGTDRKASIIQLADKEGHKHTFVGPDNGIAHYMKNLWQLDLVSCHEVSDSPLLTKEKSHTFHGRDLFAPMAAHLASTWNKGGAAADLGQVYDELMVDDALEDLLVAEMRGEDLLVKIIHIDRFGNLITGLRRTDVSSLYVTIDGNEIPFGKTFGDAMRGDPVCYWGSSGFLEIAINQGDARQVFSKKIGDVIECRVDFRNGVTFTSAEHQADQPKDD